jgi:hypothetical protein
MAVLGIIHHVEVLPFFLQGVDINLAEFKISLGQVLFGPG